MKKFESKLFSFSLLLIIFLFSYNGIFVNAEPGNVTVEGEGNHYVTGESYPSQITFVGYDVYNKKYYLNYTLQTTKANANIDYFIQLFDENGASLINDTTETGTYAAPLTGALTAQELAVTRKEVTLNNPLTAKYSLNISVKLVHD